VEALAGSRTTSHVQENKEISEKRFWKSLQIAIDIQSQKKWPTLTYGSICTTSNGLPTMSIWVTPGASVSVVVLKISSSAPWTT
jgi:hypothetical protein